MYWSCGPRVVKEDLQRVRDVHAYLRMKASLPETTHPMLVYCWTTISNAGPALNQTMSRV